MLQMHLYWVCISVNVSEFVISSSDVLDKVSHAKIRYLFFVKWRLLVTCRQAELMCR